MQYLWIHTMFAFFCSSIEHAHKPFTDMAPKLRQAAYKIKLYNINRYELASQSSVVYKVIWRCNGQGTETVVRFQQLLSRI